MIGNVIFDEADRANETPDFLDVAWDCNFEDCFDSFASWLVSCLREFDT